MSITTSTGTTVSLHQESGDTIVRCDNPAAPPAFRNHEVGRIILDTFQPAPISAIGLSVEVLRAIADLIEGLP